MTDYKQLCTELVELGSSPARSVSELAERMSLVMDLADRARAALAEPEPERPTDEELDELAWNWYSKTGSTWYQIDAFRAYARAVLARWGNHPGSPDSSTQPIPVSERLPEPEDCDAEGRCWWYGEGEDMVGWTYQDSEGFSYYKATHWLPAHALSQPSSPIN